MAGQPLGVSSKYDEMGNRIQTASSFGADICASRTEKTVTGAYSGNASGKQKEKVVKFLWDGNTPLHEWEEERTTDSIPVPRPVADYKADFLVKLEKRAEEKTRKEAEKGQEPPENLVIWIFEDDFVPRAKITKDGCYSIISDYLGTPVEAYDGDGNRVWERELDIYGRVKTGKNETGERNFIPFRFQGQYEDGETGLYYNRFRYYSPEEGCYTQRDPIGLAGGNPTLYGYVRDTNSYIDLLGLATRPNNGQYHSFFNYDLDSSLWKSTDAVQFNRANKAFIKEMNRNPAFRKKMLKRYPKLSDWLKKPRMNRSPGGMDVLTWNHSASKNGRLELVDFTDHSKNSGVYHPNQKGGRENWGGGAKCRK